MRQPVIVAKIFERIAVGKDQGFVLCLLCQIRKLPVQSVQLLDVSGGVGLIGRGSSGVQSFQLRSDRTAEFLGHFE